MSATRSFRSSLAEKRKTQELEHFVDVLEKKLKGECRDEHLFNQDAAELLRLTGHNVLYIGPNAHANMQRDLKTARKKAAASYNNQDVVQSAEDRGGHADPDRVSFLIKKFAAMPDEKLRAYGKEWTDLHKMEMEHLQCSDGPYAQCGGCSKRVCTHLSQYVCRSVAVCQWCDTHGQPNPFNPINRTAFLPESSLPRSSELCDEVDRVIASFPAQASEQRK